MHGIRDEAALDSAVFMPQQSFDGEFLHKDLFEMAAAYAFHISENQPFVDGNKRTGMAASLIFLRLNSVDLVVEQDDYEALIRSVSIGKATKADIASFLSSRFIQSI